MRLFHKPDKLFLHIVVYVAVSRECPAAFFVAAQRTDEIRVFHLLVKVAYECAPGKVTACYLVYRTLLLLPGGGVENRNDSRYPTLLKYLLDGHVVFLRTDEREQLPFQIIAPGVFLYQSLRTCIERNADDLRTFSFGLLWHIFYGSVDYACRSHSHEVGHTATDKTLKDEDVALSLQ